MIKETRKKALRNKALSEAKDIVRMWEKDSSTVWITPWDVLECCHTEWVHKEGLNEEEAGFVRAVTKRYADSYQWGGYYEQG